MSLSEDFTFSSSADSDQRVRIAVSGAFGALMVVLYIAHARRIATLVVRAIAGSASDKPLSDVTAGHYPRLKTGHCDLRVASIVTYTRVVSVETPSKKRKQLRPTGRN